MAKLLSQRLDLPLLDLDDIRWDYYAEIGYDHEAAQRIREEQGFKAFFEHWKPFEIHSVERMFQDYPAGYVISFGAGQSVYDDPGFAERAQQALAPYPVVLLLPSPDVDELVKLLSANIHQSEPELPEAFFPMIEEMNRGFLEHPANARLATLTVYTKGKSPDETCDEIVAALRLDHED